MNKYLIGLAFCLLISCKQENKTQPSDISVIQSNNNQRIDFDKTENKVTLTPRHIDVGVIERGVPVTVSSVLYNGKTEAIVINDVSTTCGCIKTYHSKDTISTGDTALIQTTYDAKIPGLFSKEINVKHTLQDTLMNVSISGHVKQ